MQKPVFDRRDVERYVARTFQSSPRGFRVGYHEQFKPKQFLGYKGGIVKTLNEIDWSRVRRITVLFPEQVQTTRLIDGDEAIRDGIRLNAERLRKKLN